MFKIRDRVIFVKWSNERKWEKGYGAEIGKIAVIEGISGKDYKIKFLGEVCIVYVTSEQLQKVGETNMYDELKERIEAVEGWDKEADNILQEIGVMYFIDIPTTNKLGRNDGTISIATAKMENPLELKCPRPIKESKVLADFYYTDQCEKLQAFKDALMWLLDHSDIKKDIVGEEVKAEIEGKIYKVKVLERS